MKKLLLLMAVLFGAAFTNAQTILFHENFDPTSGPDSVTATGTPTFAINTRLHYSGTQCDSLKTPLNNVSYLTTQSFSTVGSTNVLLKFAHICKVEIFDTAKVEISVNGGPWVKLTTQYINPGNSQFLNQSYRFCAATYAVDWWASNDTIKPDQTWWKLETFDISALAANSSNVRVRFTLRGNVSNDVCHGWYLDDIMVIGGTSELIPPKITMAPPIIQDTVFNTGPFNISAYVRDASGIDTAYIVYKLNNGANQYIPMTWVSDSTYTGTIPSYTYNNRIDYYVHAADNSSTHNSTNGPNQWFYTKHGPNTVQIGTGTSTQTYPFYMLWGYTRSAAIYQASEINTYGQILSLEWYVSTATATSCPVKIYLKSTTSSTFASGSTWASLISGATLVYDNTNSFSTVGWKLITLTTPFMYSSGNLMVLCEANYGGTGTSTYPSFQYTSTSPNYQHQTLYADNAPPTGTASLSYNRPNIKISFPPANNTQDAGVSQVVAPSGIILAGVNSPVTISIKNYAIDSLKKVTIAYKVDGILQTPAYTWNGILLQDMVSPNFSIGNVNVAPGSHTIKVWTELPNDSTDQAHNNDTVTGTFYACTSILNGPYTIGPSGADFPTFAATIAAMQNCGISGPVTFNVQSGIYTEQLTIPEIPGTSDINTITYQSTTGVNTDVTLRYTTDATNNFVVKLNGADHFRFKNMTLSSTATTAYCRIVEYTGTAVDNRFEGNNITGITATALSTNTALVYSGAGNDSLAVFDNNTFTNGSYGIYFYGIGSSSLENKTSIINNTFNNQYGRSINLYYQNAPTVSGNIINGHATNNAFYGIYAGYCDNDIKILKNKITIPLGTYGIYLYYCDGTMVKKGLIANNFVQLGGTIVTYGIYNSSSTYQEYFYNSVNITSTNTTARDFFISTSSAPIVLKNNIFANHGGGYTIYTAMTTGVTSDYNDLYTSGTNLGYWGTALANLAAWQTTSLQDAHSVSAEPQFTSSTNLHTFSNAINSKATHVAAVTDDIDGDPRDPFTPDMGADERAPYADDLGVFSVIAPVPTSCGLGTAENITIRLKNYGLNTVTSADVYYVLNNGAPVHGVFSGSILADSSVNYTFPTTANLSAISNYNFKFYVAMAGDMFLMNDTLSNYTVANGWDFYSSAYNMGFEPTDNFSGWSTLNSDLSAYKWVMPFDGSTYAHTGANSSQFYNNTANTGADWMFSRCFSLEGGKTYKLSFWYRNSIATYPQTITVKYGNAQTDAAMTSPITALTGITNITYQESVSTFTPATNGIYYLGWSGTPGVTNDVYIDDINIKLLPDQEATAVSMTSPVEGCGLGNETVTMQIYNSGGQLINGNLTAYYKIVGGGTTVSQAVTQQIPVGDTIDFIFTTPANLTVTSADSTFSIKGWIALIGDPIQPNDTTIYQVLSKYQPPTPVVISDTVGYGGIATLSSTSTDPLFWYDVPTGGSPIGTGPTFTTPNLFVTTPYYVQASNGSMPDSLSTIFTGGNGCGNGNMFDLQPLSTSLTITGFSISPYVSGAIPVSVYYKTGTYVGSETTAGNWTLLGNYNVTSAGAGIQTYLDVDDFTIPAGQPTGIYLNFNATYTTVGSITTYNNADLQLTGGAGLCAAFGSVNTPRMFNGKVYYGAGGCTSARVADTAYVMILPYDANTVSIIAPVDGCSPGQEQVTIRIRNNGSNNISGGLTAKYSVNGSTPVAESVPGTILPGDTLTYTFTTTFNSGLTSGNPDSVYNIIAYTELTGDSYLANDTAYHSAELEYIPSAPVVINDTVGYGGIATLSSTSTDPLFWYDVPTGGSPIGTGPTFTTPNLFVTTPYYVQASNGSMPDSLSTIFTGGNGCGNGNMFDLQPLSTSLTITGFSISPYVSGAIPVSVYYKTGTYVGSETTAANWTLLGNYNVTSTGAGVQTYLDVDDFTIPVGQPTGIYLNFNATYTTLGSITTYNNADLQLTGGAGLCAAFGSVNTPRMFNGKVYYGAGGCASPRVPDTAYVMVFPYDAKAVSITSPVDGCSGSPEHVTMRIRNNGADTINGGLTAKYSINGNTPVSEAVTNMILPGDTLDFTFATTFSAGLTPANTDSVYNIVAYTELTGDGYLANDTAFTAVTLAYVPPAPIVISDTVPFGASATLQGISSDSIFWYDVPTGGLPLAMGSSYTTPNLYVNTVYYAEARASGGTTTWTFDTGLDGWIASSPCSSPVTWAWSSDGGNGTAFAVDHTTNSSQLLISPAVNVNGASTMDLSYTHRYATEAGWDHGFVAYRLDGGTWVQFVPTVGAYNTNDAQNGEPLWNSCNSSPSMPLYDGTMAYATHSGPINTAGANLLEIAFVFTTDASGGVDGWYIDEVTVDGGVGGCASARVPDTAYVVLLPYEASIVSLPAPVDQCTDGSESVTIRIRNNGYNTINGGLTAKYTINGSTPVAEPVTNTILAGDTLTFTFTTPFLAGLSSANQDSLYNITSYLELTGDTYSLNDTLNHAVTLIYTPPAPVLTNITIPYATSGTMTGVAADSIYWFDVPTGGTALQVGSAYTTPILYGTTVYYAETRTTGGTSTWTFDNNLQGWTVQSPCSTPNNWAWNADGGNGALFAVDPSSNSSQLIVSPVISVGGTPSVTLSFDHHYTTESCCDEGYVAYRLDGGAWTQFTPSVNSYVGSHNIDNDPLNNCVSNSKSSFYGTQATMITSSGTINTTGASNIELAFVFTSDGSVGSTGWYINAVELEGGTGACPSDRLPDTVFVTGVPACDVSVQAIHTPNSGIELSASETVSVRVKNYGTSPAVNIPIHYTINGGTAVTETIPGPIASNDTLLYTFTTTADLSAIATYNLVVYTDLSCDVTLANDTVYKTIINNPLVYCTSIPSNTGDEEIFSVTVNGATNAYDCSTVAPGPGSILNRYSNFMTLPPLTALGQGASYSFTILEDECDGAYYYSNGCAIWIDYNHDGDFTDAGEQVYVENTTTQGPRTITGTFTVPVGGFSGVTGMRIIVAESNSGSSLQPCMTYGYGETEDYRIRILPQIPHDAGVTAFVQPTTPLNEGVSTPVQVTVRNFGTDPITNASNMLIAYSYDGGPVQSVTWTGGDIIPLATVNVTLPNITVLPNDRSLCAWTVLAGDSNTFNDTTCMTLHGNPQIDAGITAFLQPAATLVEGANATVQVTLRNFGVDTLTSMNLVYQTNGTVQATQPWTGTLLPGASTNVTFTQTFVVPMAAFDICAYSSLVTDANHVNDTACMSSYGVFTSNLPYYDHFDATTVNWLPGPASNGSVWELGTPNYGITNSAHSAPNAWDVNLTTAYTNSATAYLYTQNFNFSTAVNARMKFWINYDVEANNDGVRIEYTTDGTTWNTLGILSDPNGVNWYNDDVITSSGLPGWTNPASGWKQCEYKLTALNNTPLVRFRFVFNSSSSTYNSGVSVDDFSITVPQPQDAGVEVIHKPVMQAAAGSTNTVKVRIRNFGSDTLYSIPVSYRIGLTGTPITQTWTGTLYPQDTTTVYFTTPFTAPTGVFDFYSYTGLTADSDHMNDTAVNHITGIPTYSVPYNTDFEGTVTWFTPGT
ncbi:MAG TPA: GEVED domain-containing protein, partial [Bacteroidales bacterium]|nr:GEVED domain-containing protein [Bacteroidales bacterium]